MFIGDVPFPHMLPHKPSQLLPIDDLFLQEDLSHLLKKLFLVAQRLSHRAVRILHDPLDLVVYLARRLLAVILRVRLGIDVEKHRFSFLLVRDVAHPLAHPEFLDHRFRNVRRLGEVVVGPCRDFPEGHLFRDPAAQEHCQPVEKLLLRHQVPVLCGPLHGVAQGGDPPRV